MGWAIGYWLDGVFDTAPWLTMLFFAAGIAAGFKGVLRVARQARQVGEDSDS